MKKYLIPLAILVCATTAARAVPEEDTVTLPEMKAVESWHHPLVLAHTPPVYPVELRKAGVEGRVRLEVAVGAGGEVKAVRVLESKSPEFAVAVRDAVRRWKFVPNTSSAAKPWHAHITFRFVLEDAA